MKNSELSKEAFYKIRGESYSTEDPEALIRYEKAVSWLQIQEKMVIREVGCKFAILRDILKKTLSQADYIAIDIDEATLKKIPAYNPAQFICHDVTSGMPFEDSSADYVVCLEVIEHLENPTKFFQETKRVLKPGGKLLISVPNPYCWMELASNIKHAPDSEGHISSFTQQNINALLNFSGLKLVAEQGTYTHIPFSRRVFGKYKIVLSNNIFLTRSKMYLIEKPFLT